ncbi:HlyIII-domain-containing protein [Tilletiaria anomala UBC 951]|uniref:HlyIII-domain-containing protein n=1 Tax=Tilletiaria anomala (strain ATCC 24038 / CBS 436.72 / UBC 951) TaxID=1037660 RepID=A0A066VDC1_TILAU|nr:HlyIII-domain-containing protein [Tilletiaria anomala UBC 951]KDN36595.1 HlyIII-domain-containing protein [Tilletiaria anomala UBC 951]
MRIAPRALEAIQARRTRITSTIGAKARVTWQSKLHTREAPWNTWLDLPASLPLTLAALRDQVLAHLAAVEARFQSLRQSLPSTIAVSEKMFRSPSWYLKQGNDDFDAPDKYGDPMDQAILSSFYSHLSLLREELKLLVQRLPSSSSTVSSPFASSQMGISSLPSSLSLPRMPVNVNMLFDAFYARLPATPPSISPPNAAADDHHKDPKFEAACDLRRLLSAIKNNLEAVNETVNSVARKDCLLNAWSTLHQENHISRTLTRTRSGSFSALQSAQLSLVAANARESTAAFVRRMEERLVSLANTGRDRANDVVHRAAEAAKQTEDKIYRTALDLAKGGRQLITYADLPELWKNNEYILGGYRFIPSRNWGALLRSTFEVHNETGNILSHLIGIFIVLPLFWPDANSTSDVHTTPMDRLVQTIYLIAAVKCLVLSVSWHVMAGCADHKIFETFACVDYTGIAWLVAASIWTVIYNCFYCQPNLALLYSATTFIVGLVGAIVPFMDFFNRRENKKWRIAMFLGMCFTGIAPFSHAAFEQGLGKTAQFLSPIFPSLLAYVAGLVFYATHFPESLRPGLFDVVGHAHQWWHISIVIAICLHYRAALIWHEQRFDFSCAGTPPSASLPAFNELLASAGGLGGTHSLDRADKKIHRMRQFLGTLAGGNVGRFYDVIVDFLQTSF